MKIINVAALSAVLALSLGTTPAMSQRARIAARATASGTDPLAMDVAGVRLGMPLVKTLAALAGTYQCSTYRSASFRQLVDSEVRKRKGSAEGFGPDGTAVGELTCKGPTGEYLRLFMAQTPTGEIVDRIDLTVPTNRVDPAALVRQVEGKYGRPTEGTPANGSWCIGPCGYGWGDTPKMVTDAGPQYFKIMGNRGRRARLADEAAVKTAAAREVPSASHGAF